MDYVCLEATSVRTVKVYPDNTSQSISWADTLSSIKLINHVRTVGKANPYSEDKIKVKKSCKGILLGWKLGFAAEKKTFTQKGWITTGCYFKVFVF